MLTNKRSVRRAVLAEIAALIRINCDNGNESELFGTGLLDDIPERLHEYACQVAGEVADALEKRSQA